MLFKVMSSIYTKKWSDQFVPGQLQEVMQQWASGLAGLNPDQIQHAIDQCRITLDWPPSIAQFRIFAQSGVNPGQAYKEFHTQKSGDRNPELARQSISKIKNILYKS